jgi:hypothetical protein
MKNLIKEICDVEEEELHLDSMKLELPKEGVVIPVIIGEPLQFRSREEDEE